MISLRGKLFQNIKTRKIEAFPYNEKNDYYKLIEQAQKKGYTQSIVTSDIMIGLIEYFLIEKKAKLISVSFFVEDSELESEINYILDKMSEESIYWVNLKEKLIFLSNDSSIDIKQIEFNCSKYLVSVFVNGIFEVTDKYYKQISKELESFMEEYVK